ncbi:hypothetical protein NUG22_08855, partial [Saccharothrix longispora]|nr:hypothetical protein [Saccharothrix longispora]
MRAGRISGLKWPSVADGNFVVPFDGNQPNLRRRRRRNVWVDHVDLLASGGESEGYDGLFDMKDDTQYVTLSYST